MGSTNAIGAVTQNLARHANHGLAIAAERVARDKTPAATTPITPPDRTDPPTRAGRGNQTPPAAQSHGSDRTRDTQAFVPADVEASRAAASSLRLQAQLSAGTAAAPAAASQLAAAQSDGTSNAGAEAQRADALGAYRQAASLASGRTAPVTERTTSTAEAAAAAVEAAKAKGTGGLSLLDTSQLRPNAIRV